MFVCFWVNLDSPPSSNERTNNDDNNKHTEQEKPTREPKEENREKGLFLYLIVCGQFLCQQPAQMKSLCNTFDINSADIDIEKACQKKSADW